MAKEIQRGESPDYVKLPAFGKKKEIQRGESPDYVKLPAFGKRDECAHDDHPALVLDERKRRDYPRKPMRWVSLHHHSTYSYLDAFQLPDAHARRIAELNGSAVAMTEHGNMMSHAKFEAAVKKESNEAYGIKPIFGLEAYTGSTDEENRSRIKNHLVLLAKNAEGYRNLLALVSRSWEDFYQLPTIDGKALNENKEGLIVLSGCQNSLLFTSLVGGKHVKIEHASYERAKEVARRFKTSLDGNYFIEVQAFPGLPLTREANPQLARIARELKIPLVATLDCHYTVPKEREIQKVLHAIRGQDSLEEGSDWGYTTDLCPPLTDRMLMRRLIETGLTKSEAIDAILNTEMIAQECTVELPKLPMVRFPLPPGYSDSWALFEDYLKEGWYFRGVERMAWAERRRYKERLHHELNVIRGKDFADYFLIVSDAVKFAKDADIGVGPARGSAAASLVCWLLRITEVNPMLFGHLVFERFIDTTREDLPDIDLDFESARRGEVDDYLISKYGAERVNKIGTFTKFKSKNALDDVARIHRIPAYEVQAIKDVLVERSGGDLRASATIEDTIEQFDQARAVAERYPQVYQASDLEGNVRGFGTHAAGVVISTEDMREVVPVLRREVQKKMVQVVGVDKYDAEYLGMLKLDFLGLSAIDSLVAMCRTIGEKPSFLYDIPIEDEKTIQGFKENDVVGVFQFEGRATRMVNGSIKPDDFNEICHITALSRPGPLHNGAVTDYVDIKRGVKKPSLIHPALNEITEFTQFQVVYQEQILRIVREIGDFDWTHAAYIRRIISRKLGDAEFNRQYDRFWEGCQKLHPDISPELARDIWGLCTTAGSYAFNAAHSISYGYIAWWTQWFKQHHQDAFFAAKLTQADRHKGGDSSNPKASVQSKAKLDPHEIMLRDAIYHDFEVMPFDVMASDITWKTEGGKKLRPGFDQIRGIGESMANRIIDWRNETDEKYLDWDDLIQVKGIGEKTIANIVAHATSDDPFNVMRLDRMINAVKRDIPSLGLPHPTHTAIEVPYESGEDTEVVWVGVAVHRNLRDIFETNRSRTGEELDPASVRQPELNEWMLIAGYDGTDLLSIRISRFKYPNFKRVLWKIQPNQDVLVVRGVKPRWRTAREIYLNDLWVVEPGT